MSNFDTIETRVLSKGELGQVVRYLREIRQWSQETLIALRTGMHSVTFLTPQKYCRANERPL